MYDILAVTYDGESDENLERFFRSIFDAARDNLSSLFLILDGPISANKKKIVTRWSSLLPVVLHGEPKQGLSACLNVGLNLCRSEYIVRADTDDTNLPERFEYQYAAIKEKDVELYSNGILEKGENATTRIRLFPNQLISSRNLAMILVNRVNHNCCIFRREAIRNLGGYPAGRMEDFRLWISVLRAGGKIALDPTVLVHASVSGLVSRRVGADYRTAEWALFKLNVHRGWAHACCAVGALLVRFPLRLTMFSRMLGRAHNLQRALSQSELS